MNTEIAAKKAALLSLLERAKNGEYLMYSIEEIEALLEDLE